jgi:S1-C subfamily serine protease
MKTLLCAFFSLIVIYNVHSQQAIVVASNTGAVIFNAQKSIGTLVVTSDDRDKLVIAHQEGFTTRGLSVEDVLKKAGTTYTRYTINIEKSVFPQISKDSKKLKFVTLIDKSSRLGPYTSTYNGTLIQNPGVDLSDVMFNNGLAAVMNEKGFNMIGLNSSGLFKEKEKNPDLAIGVEIIQVNIQTKGTPGFKIALLANWSIFDITQEKIVFTTTTAGYSDSKLAHSMSDELLLTLKNALTGLITDKNLAKLVNIKSDSIAVNNKILAEPLVLPNVLKSVGNNESMIEAAVKSVVTIKTEYGHGSGFVISTNGYVLTNSHVVNNSSNLEIIFSNGLSLPALLVAENKKRDVALLKVVGNGYRALPINLDDNINKVGADVIAIGTPQDISLGQSVTKGIISGKRVFEDLQYIQTDVSINSGNSGGALINNNGEVIGIIVSKLIGSGVEGLGFAIPINSALQDLNIQINK